MTLARSDASKVKAMASASGSLCTCDTQELDQQRIADKRVRVKLQSGCAKSSSGASLAFHLHDSPMHALRKLRPVPVYAMQLRRHLK